MFHRLPHLLVVCIVFGSMWIQGMVPISSDDHGMMERTCLEHCLASFHLGTVDDGGVVSVGMMFAPPLVLDELARTLQSESVQVFHESHHDPGRILTTIKRE